jgi:hypothetical protein
MKALARAILFLCPTLLLHPSDAPSAASPPAPGRPAAGPTLRAVRGPAEVDLAGLGQVVIPKGCFFTDAIGARQLLERTDQGWEGEILGLLAPHAGGWIAWLELQPGDPAAWPSDPGARRERILEGLRARAGRGGNPRVSVSVRAEADQPAPGNPASLDLPGLRLSVGEAELRWCAEARPGERGLLWLQVRELRARVLSPALVREIAANLLFAPPNAGLPIQSVREHANAQSPGSGGWGGWRFSGALAAAGIGLGLALVGWRRRRRGLPPSSARPVVLVGPAGPGRISSPSAGPSGLAGAGPRRHRARRFDYDRFYYDLLRDL